MIKFISYRGNPEVWTWVTGTAKQVLMLFSRFSDRAVNWNTRTAVKGMNGDSKRKPQSTWKHGGSCKQLSIMHCLWTTAMQVVRFVGQRRGFQGFGLVIQSS